MHAWPYVLGFAPVMLFLAGLRVMDSYQLVHPRPLALAMALGSVAAALAYGVNHALRASLHVDVEMLRHVIGPVVEECLKALAVWWLLQRDRAGFLVDAAILGFAVGTGFALVENLYYVGALADPSPALWLARGLGTAVMHGSTAAVVAILAKELEERDARGLAGATLTGVPLAIVVHAAFNALPFHPLLTTAGLLVLMPLLLVAVYERSERLTRSWIVTGFDSEVEMLEQILGQGVRDTAVGRYLETLRRRFPPLVVADLLCLLRIHLELALRAKGMLIARAAGIEVRPNADVRANLVELHHLERTVGATGRLAILPLRRTRSRDLWQIMLLERTAGRDARRDS